MGVTVVDICKDLEGVNIFKFSTSVYFVCGYFFIDTNNSAISANDRNVVLYNSLNKGICKMEVLGVPIGEL